MAHALNSQSNDANTNAHRCYVWYLTEWLLFESCIAFLSNVQYMQGYKGTKTVIQIQLGKVVYKNPSRLNT